MKTEIVEELKSLFRDYGVGVVRRGRRIPDPVKVRISALITSGIPVREISHATGISVTTLLSWKQKSIPKNFKRVEILPLPPISKIRIFISETIWLETDEKSLSPELLGKLRAIS
jgi:hypothetical protein